METIPKILHMIWIGEKQAPDYYYIHFDKWKQLMPDWEFKLWSNQELQPELIDYTYLDLINKSTIGAQKADLLRYYVVNKFGGYYVDADIIPERSLSELDSKNKNLILCHDLEITWGYIINSFFAATPDHPLLELILRQMYSVDFNNKDIHLTTGPAALGGAYQCMKENLDCLILPYWYFYRNKKGDLDLNGTYLTEDREDIFGSHRYAATWTTNE